MAADPRRAPLLRRPRGSLGPAAGARPATGYRRLEALGCTAPPPPRVLDAWRERRRRRPGTLTATSRRSRRRHHSRRRRDPIVETTGGEITARNARGRAAGPGRPPPPPASSLTAPAPGGARPPRSRRRRLARSRPGPRRRRTRRRARRPACESTTVVTQRPSTAKVTRSSACRGGGEPQCEAPQTRVQTLRSSGGRRGATTARSSRRRIGPSADLRRGTAARDRQPMWRSCTKGALPAVGTPSSAATPTPTSTIPRDLILLLQDNRPSTEQPRRHSGSCSIWPRPGQK